MLDAVIVGRVIQQFREERGVSQEVMSGLAGIGRTHLSAIERGERRPTMDTFFKICEAMNVCPSTVMAKIEEELADLTGLAQVVIDENGELSFRFLPCIYGNGVTKLLTDPVEKAQAIKYFQSLSTGVSIDPDGWVTQED